MAAQFLSDKKSDKDSLFNRGSIGEMGLCFKKNKSQYMGVLGYTLARGIVRDARAGEAGLRNGRSQRMGSGNPSNLSGFVRVGHWPWIGVFF
jgi:hypothetical protein